MELNAAGATAARYTLAPFGYGDLVSQRRSSVSGFYHFDALGTTRRVTAADESTQLTYVRDAFGVGIASTGTTTNRFRYLGKLGYVQEDTLAGALLRRRYYQYELGRFVSRDPLRDPGRSEYGYVLNRPTVGVDPGGLWWCDECAGLNIVLRAVCWWTCKPRVKPKPKAPPYQPAPGDPVLPPRDGGGPKEWGCKALCYAWAEAMERGPEECKPLGESPFDPVDTFLDFCLKGCEGRYTPDRKGWRNVCQYMPDPELCCESLYQQCVARGDWEPTCRHSQTYCSQ
jgi:RHS repeat-associated protein